MDVHWRSLTFFDILWRSLTFFYVLLCSFMFFYDLLCSFMFFDVLWRSLTLIDILWCSLTFFGVLWRSLMFFYVRWCFLMFFDFLWHSLKFFDVLWSFDEQFWWYIFMRHLMRHSNETLCWDIIMKPFYETYWSEIWMAFDELWWPVMTFYYVWFGDDVNGMVLWQFLLSLVWLDQS